MEYNLFVKEWENKTEQIKNRLSDYFLEECEPQSTVSSAVNYSLSAGGKRLRPLFLLESNLLCGGEGIEDELVFSFAAALEMIHTYSLVHDDLPAMDNDKYRRGKLTTHAKYGEAMGILAGDALLNLAFETVAKALLKEKNTERLCAGVRAFSLLAKKAGVKGMIGGQVIDIEMTGAKNTPIEVLNTMYKLKTGALLEAAFGIGGILAGAKEETIIALIQIAEKVGLAFQIQDDILDITSSTEVLGKPVHSDEKNEKITYMNWYSVEQAKKIVESLSKEARDILALTMENGGFAKSPRFLDLLIEALIDRKF